ncbi:hypothetical protein BIZ38_18450 [Pseudoalteromonas sp. BZK2]|uniref:hypothetical protein n=1 Tax=Pseudoalteromonas sp. BZK2 TaxID=1904458 RepID=UPI00165454FA|nr:hypothetical protein [Pseudoalteromonas sp. BZK2]MBC7010429.1 hypothetical protein [Pseudoalteromonas sp. BZK2]
MKYIAIIFLLLSGNSFADDCKNIYENIKKDSLKLNIEAFDQTTGSGWRILEEKHCYSQSAQLIDEYIKENGNVSSLLWHQLQMNAMSGNYKLAVAIGNKILEKEYSRQDNSPFLWAEYVEGTLAFLEEDNQRLVQNRNKLSSSADFPPNKMNLVVLDRLIDCIKCSYKKAYTGN